MHVCNVNMAVGHDLRLMSHHTLVYCTLYPLQVVQEAASVFGPEVPLDGPLPSMDVLRRLQYTEACLREALRKYR